jgi:phosphatidate cytidylyltransferase
MAAPAREPRAARALATRTATAVLGIPVTVLLVVLGKLWLLGGIAAVIVVGLLEFYRMAERGGYRPVREAGVGAGLLFALAGAYSVPWAPLILPGLLVYSVLRMLRGGRPGQWLVNTAITLLGALYVGYLLSYVERLRVLPLGPAHREGPVAALLVICIAWGADTAAYFVGLALGRHKLLPHVSPNKSLEGAAAAILAGVVVGLVFAWVAGLDLWMSVAVGALCAAASVCGDLWESAIKREAGVKDAGGVLPGHGGVLDRFDGLLFAAVTGYAVMTWWPRS